MPLFTRKPVIVEGFQWFKNGDHPGDYLGDTDGFEDGKYVKFSGEYRKKLGWEGSVVRYFRHPDISGKSKCKHCGIIMHNHGWMENARNGRTICPGDWFVLRPDNVYHPVRQAVFPLEYEPLIPATAT